MGDEVSEPLLLRLSEIIAANMGLHYPRDRWRDLQRALGKAAPDLGFADEQSCLKWLMEAPLSQSQIDVLADYLTIGETHFFRDERLFQLLETRIIPDLMQARRTDGRNLKIWSAGCATGEEPYTIAIVLSRVLAGLPGWRPTLLATDINRRFLQKAVEGVYTSWSFRSVPPGIKETFFRLIGDTLEIVPAIKDMVKFAFLNLAKDTYPSPLNDTHSVDVIFCRNVLMYFTIERQEQVVDGFFRSLVDGGWLVVSPAEASCVNHSGFVTVNFPGAVLFRKDLSRPAVSSGFNPYFLNIASTPASPAPVFTFEPPSAPVPVVEQFQAFKAAAEPSIEQIPPWPWLDAAHTEPVQETAWPATFSEVTPIEPVAQPEMATYAQALALFDAGQYPDAAEKLLMLLDGKHLPDGDSGTAMSLLTKAYANQGMLEEALVWSKKAVDTDKLNSDYHYLHGTILQEQGELAQAVTALTRATFLEPDHVVAHFALGNLNRALGQSKEADRHFRAALTVLGKYCEEDPVSASDGLNAGRLKEIILTMTRKGAAS